jgi:hypothetical protein
MLYVAGAKESSIMLEASMMPIQARKKVCWVQHTL